MNTLALFDLDEVAGPPGALVVQRVNHQTARIPCEQWHYLGAMPGALTDTFGVWENGHFRGILAFGSPIAREAFSMLGLSDVAGIRELLRIALNGHSVTLTTILSKSIQLLRRYNPNLEVLLSYADPNVGHHGGIYQAASWTYIGKSEPARYYIVHGEKVWNRTASARWSTRTLEHLHAHVDPNAQRIYALPRHKYAFGLNRRMRKLLAGMAQPYPKG